jgi:hypothetical protein
MQSQTRGEVSAPESFLPSIQESDGGDRSGSCTPSSTAMRTSLLPTWASSRSTSSAAARHSALSSAAWSSAPCTPNGFPCESARGSADKPALRTPGSSWCTASRILVATYDRHGSVKCVEPEQTWHNAARGMQTVRDSVSGVRDRTSSSSSSQSTSAMSGFGGFSSGSDSVACDWSRDAWSVFIFMLIILIDARAATGAGSALAEFILFFYCQGISCPLRARSLPALSPLRLELRTSHAHKDSRLTQHVVCCCNAWPW